MKIIISHDVDHLFGKDHWFRDLIYPKLWVRSFLQLLSRRISWKQCWLRCASCFRRQRHRIDAVMAFDRQHGVPSTFFFGMNQGLGMSYYPEEAKPVIAHVHDMGFDVGVHGIAYDDREAIEKEYKTFVNTAGFEPCGIRMHYVRFDQDTFAKEAAAGYRFDSTEFDKTQGGTMKAPYKVGNMWEFPLTIMDGYLPQSFQGAKAETLSRLKKCEELGLAYVTILFHEYQFTDAYEDMKAWYEWLIQYIEQEENYSFVSFQEAINELEDNGWQTIS